MDTQCAKCLDSGLKTIDVLTGNFIPVPPMSSKPAEQLCDCKAAEKKWIEEEFATLGTSASIEELEEAIANAKLAMEAGKWREIHMIVCTEKYEDHTYLAFWGLYPETDYRQVQRLESAWRHRLTREREERKEFNRLRAKFEGLP